MKICNDSGTKNLAHMFFPVPRHFKDNMVGNPLVTFSIPYVLLLFFQRHAVDCEVYSVGPVMDGNSDLEVLFIFLFDGQTSPEFLDANRMSIR